MLVSYKKFVLQGENENYFKKDMQIRQNWPFDTNFLKTTDLEEVSIL